MYVCIHGITRLTILKMEMKMKNKSDAYNINRPMSDWIEKSVAYIKKACTLWSIFQRSL